MKKSVVIPLIFLFVLPLLSKEPIQEKIERIIAQITPELIEIRRDIHANPELSFQEKRTSRIVADYFKRLGLDVREGIGGTGVLGILRGSKPGPVLGFRADMDALPITEETDLPFASKVKVVIDGRETGVMHACGHDVHTTILLGVANVLSRIRNELSGTVLFVAQPAEEWGDGANEMLKDGVFKDVKPEKMFAFHVDDDLNVGFVRYTPGYSGANCDGFHLIIKSQGCHGSSPSSCVDPVVVGSHIVIALQLMVSREISVHDNTVITVGSFHAGTAPNVIPQKAEMKAIVRSYGEEQRKVLKEKVERVIKNICESAGANYELNYYFGTPSLYNNPDLLKEILPTVEKILVKKEFLVEGRPEMGGEDFSYFAREIPSLMLGLGVCPQDVKSNSVHSPTFVVDERSIPLGVNLMTNIILNYSRKGRK
ncbi:MAG: M20 metallopeptidase family protein [Candidatus Aminicenantia bacterium]